MTYFDLRPKSRLEDFYDRRRELNELRLGIERREPLILVLGLRRYGKTSLVLTCMEEYRIPYIYVNCRLLPSPSPISPADLVLLFADGLSAFLNRRRSFLEKMRNILGRIEGITIVGFNVRIKAAKASYETIIDIFNSINMLGKHIVVVVDEAQELRRLARYRFDSLLAYVYDHLPNVTVILTGSEIGLLYRLIRKGDPEAPLYGRFYREIKLSPLNSEKSKDFLIKGFKQEGLNPPNWFIDLAVEKLNGVIGWLSYLGYYTAVKGIFTRKVVYDVLTEAGRIALSELENFLKLRPLARKRYIAILKGIAQLGEASWSRIYRLAEAEAGRIPKPTFNEMLHNLLDASFIQKKNSVYRIADPVLRYALINL